MDGGYRCLFGYREALLGKGSPARGSCPGGVGSIEFGLSGGGLLTGSRRAPLGSGVHLLSTRIRSGGLGVETNQAGEDLHHVAGGGDAVLHC